MTKRSDGAVEEVKIPSAANLRNVETGNTM